jgi:protein farnesyltransferase subunit beta
MANNEVDQLFCQSSSSEEEEEEDNNNNNNNNNNSNNNKYNTNSFKYKDSETSITQRELERTVRDIYEGNHLKTNINININSEYTFKLERERHIKYIIKHIRELHETYQSLDASRCWIVYWLTHSLNLLGFDFDRDDDDDLRELESDVVDFVESCQSEDGGFGGGPGHLAHLAATYAAIATLVSVGTKKAMEVVDVRKLKRWLLKLKTEEVRAKDGSLVGSFAMHVDGESDVRGSYCALACAHLCGVLDDQLTRGVENYVRICQTHEGGFAGEPGAEAHGGYAYCGIATLVLCKMVEERNNNTNNSSNSSSKKDRHGGADLNKFEEWLVSRQCGVEGGFNGRTNKLCDGCYSFWIGASFPLLEVLRDGENSPLLFKTRTRKDLTQNFANERLQFSRGASMQNEVPVFRSSANLLDTAADICNLVEETVDFDILGEIYDARTDHHHHEMMALNSSSITCSKIPRVPREDLKEASKDVKIPLHFDRKRLSFNARALQGWILGCCQCAKGGLRDKPGKSPDFYHTCYCLSGLSVAQWFGELPILGGANGCEDNIVERTNVLVNVIESKYEAWMMNLPLN